MEDTRRWSRFNKRSIKVLSYHCLPCDDDNEFPDSSHQDLIYSVIDDVEVDLQAEPFGSPATISPITMKKSNEISSGGGNQRRQES